MGQPRRMDTWTLPNRTASGPPRELAQFIGYSESTITRMVSRAPDKPPPRVAVLSRPRWDPDIVRKWVVEASRPQTQARMGRPRNRVRSKGKDGNV